MGEKSGRRAEEVKRGEEHAGGRRYEIRPKDNTATRQRNRYCRVYDLILTEIYEFRLDFPRSLRNVFESFEDGLLDQRLQVVSDIVRPDSRLQPANRVRAQSQ